MLLFDPQTSGGLLVAVPPEGEAEFVASLAARRVRGLARGRGRRGRRARGRLTRRRDVSPGGPAVRRAADRSLTPARAQPKISLYGLRTVARRGRTGPGRLLVAPERTKRRTNMKRTLVCALALSAARGRSRAGPGRPGGLQGPPAVHAVPGHVPRRLREQPVRPAGVPRRPDEGGQGDPRLGRGGGPGAVPQLPGEGGRDAAERPPDHAQLRERGEEGGRDDRGAVAGLVQGHVRRRARCRTWGTAARATP